MEIITGELSLHYEGYGFVVPPKKGGSDVFVPARQIRNALHGDTVEVKVRPGRKGLLEGEITRIIQRRLKQLVGRLERAGKHWSVVSEDLRVRHRLFLTESPKSAGHGDYVVALITKYPEGEKPMEGRVVEVLPQRGTLSAEVEFIIAKHQWPKKFPQEVEQEAKQFHSGSDVTPPQNYQQLLNLPFVTIDGDDAKDFDDAVCAKILNNGHIQLWVAIADVSNYVAAPKVLDAEALSRATSVYFPGRVLPMLPEVLSNDLCSLRPDEPRLAMVAEMELDKNGDVFHEKFYPAIFKSQARLTYNFVKRMLVDKEVGVRSDNASLLPLLENLSEAANRLKVMRGQRGTLDFDLPEPEIILDMTGGIEDIERSQRHWGHQIIEELMIAANEAVARFLTAKKVGCVYRVHDNPPPEKIRLFSNLIHRLGYKGRISFPPTPKHLSHVIQFFKGHAEERFVNSLMLRSMSQAVYSADNGGHYGLGSACYCHFTSPIRRYPDLIVHRLLKKALFGAGKGAKNFAQIGEMAQHCSRQERRALEMEREVLALHNALFLQQKIGEAFNGIISHVAKFGFFVELIDCFVEGLVPKESLVGDQYVYDEEHLCLKGRKHKKMFKIGDGVRIAVEEVKLAERRAFFKLLDSSRKK